MTFYKESGCSDALYHLLASVNKADGNSHVPQQTETAMLNIFGETRRKDVCKASNLERAQ